MHRPRIAARLSLLLLAAAIPLTALAQSATPAPAAKRPMQFEDLQKMRRLGDLAVSPDGRWVLFSVTDVDLAKNAKTSHLWIVPSTGGDEKPVTTSLAGESRGRFSPDGKQVLFISAREGSPQIYLADFDGQTGSLGQARRLTDAAMGVDSALWSPDGRNILYSSSVYPECSGGGASAAAPPLENAASVDSAAPANADSLVSATAGRGQAAPDENACNRARQQAQANAKTHAQLFTHLLYRHWNAYTGAMRSHLFLQPVAGGPVRDLNAGDPHEIPPFALGGPDPYAFSPDGRELAYEENVHPEPAISTHVELWTLDLTRPDAKPVRISTSAGGNFSPAYSPDGKYIAWRSQARAGYESDRFRLVVYDRASRQIREPLPNFDRWIDELAWAPDAHTLYFTYGDYGEERVNSVEVDGSHLTKVARAGEYGDLHPTPDGKLLIVTRTTARMPGEVCALKLDVPERVSAERQDAKALPGTVGSGAYHVVAEAQLTHLNTALLARLDLPELERFWFAGAGKRRVQGFLIRPPAFDPGKKYPVKFLIHGGPEGAWGDSWSYRWNPELFAADGYVVVMINPRGSTGYGQSFIDGVNGDWGGKPFIDLMRGLDAAEQRYPFIDKNRECALGASYGAYMANWILGHTDRFKCIVSHDGMFNPESAYGSTEELWFAEWEFKGTPWTNRANYRRWSPMLAETRFKTPTLVIHGQLDYRLDLSEGLQLFTTLQRLKVPSEMLYFPDEGHWVLKPQNSELWYSTVNAWCDRWTGKPAGASNTSAQP